MNVELTTKTKINTSINFGACDDYDIWRDQLLTEDPEGYDLWRNKLLNLEEDPSFDNFISNLAEDESAWPA